MLSCLELLLARYTISLNWCDANEIIKILFFRIVDDVVVAWRVWKINCIVVLSDMEIFHYTVNQSAEKNTPQFPATCSLFFSLKIIQNFSFLNDFQGEKKKQRMHHELIQIDVFIVYFKNDFQKNIMKT